MKISIGLINLELDYNYSMIMIMKHLIIKEIIIQ